MMKVITQENVAVVAGGTYESDYLREQARRELEQQLRDLEDLLENQRRRGQR